MAHEDSAPTPPREKKSVTPPKRKAVARKSPCFRWKVPKVRPEQPSQKPYWQIWVDNGKAVPKEEWDKVSHDGSYNIDHYLYGTPKKNLDD